MKKVFLMLSVLFFSSALTSVAFAQGADRLVVSNDDAFLQGCAAYKEEDWISAMFFLKRAVTSKKYFTDEVLYMLIAAEMYAGEYKMAESDCVSFMNSFKKSPYLSFVQYQRGRALHYLGSNEQSILILSDFCHENVESDLYPSALFWIAEAFYAEYNYDSARALYERVVNEFPDDAKVRDAQRRLDSIDQRNREEKLLYLLKVTGEEYLSAKEDYERQLKIYKTEDMMGLKKQLSAAEAKIAELERQLEEQQYLTDEIFEKEPAEYVSEDTSTITSDYYSDDPNINALKRKARYLEHYMNDRDEANLEAAIKENVYEKIPAQR